MPTTYLFTFPATVEPDELESTLVLALMGAESLHSAADLMLDARRYLDRDARTCRIEAGSPAGHTLARLFTGYLIREFGEDGFQVEQRPAQGDSIGTCPSSGTTI